MANNSSRSDRGRDPLAELARLIGQGELSSGGISRESYGAARPRATPAREADWAPEDRYDPPAPRGDTRYRYAAQPSSDPYASPGYHQAQDRYQGHKAGYQEGGYQGAYQGQAYPDQGFDEPAGSRFFSGPAGQFNGFREEPGQDFHRDGHQCDYDDGQPQTSQANDLPVFPFAPDDPRYEGDEQHYADEAAAADNAYREPRRSASRTVLVAAMAVFALVVVGSAGAFGYRTMFGGSVLPTLPPIIKASSGPNKIALDLQAGAAAGNVQGNATTGSTENLVSGEEQPVTIEAPKAAPRVVATTPVVGNGQNSVPTGISGMPAIQNVPNRVASADPPWPASPVAAVAPAAAAPAVAAAPLPAQASPEPKKIRTVTIRSDQTGTVPDGATSTATAATAAGAAHPQSRTATAPRPAAGGAAPMSTVSGQGDTPPRVRTSTAPSGGGSYVQVTSRRSEGEAQAEFRTLQGRFPDQLNGREPIIRRADLREKGVFYRAYVGPFPTTEEAAQLCGSLKAAGQNCIVQRN